MNNKHYKLHYGNFFNCSPSEKRKLRYLLRIKKQPLMTKKDIKKYLDCLFREHQIKKDFYYYLLSPTESDMYIDITKKLKMSAFKQNQMNKKESNIPTILLKMWRSYERTKSQNYQKDRMITYDKGYYLHSDPVLKKYDIFFRKNVSKYTSRLIDVLTNNHKKNQRITSAFLLGWSKEIKKVQKALEQTFINDSEHEVHNAAARSLFPVLFKKNKIRINPYLNLLCHPHTLCRNKACGIFASVSLTKKQKRIIIKKASDILIDMHRSPHPYNKRPANLLAQRWNIQKMFKND